MSKDLIQALGGLDLHGMVEAFSRVIEAHHSARHPFQNPINADAMIALRELRGLVPILSRHRSNVESVELPRGDSEQLLWRCAISHQERWSWETPTIPGKWQRAASKPRSLYTASTVRSLIASAVEREREECAKVCGDEAVFRQGKASMIGIDSHAGAEWNAHSGFEAGRIACAAAIRARWEK